MNYAWMFLRRWQHRERIGRKVKFTEEDTRLISLLLAQLLSPRRTAVRERRKIEVVKESRKHDKSANKVLGTCACASLSLSSSSKFQHGPRQSVRLILIAQSLESAPSTNQPRRTCYRSTFLLRAFTVNNPRRCDFIKKKSVVSHNLVSAASWFLREKLNPPGSTVDFNQRIKVTCICSFCHQAP